MLGFLERGEIVYTHDLVFVLGNDVSHFHSVLAHELHDVRYKELLELNDLSFSLLMNRVRASFEAGEIRQKVLGSSRVNPRIANDELILSFP